MAIKPIESGAALLGGALVAVAATMEPVKKANAFAPGILAALAGIAAVAFSKDGPLNTAGYGAMGVAGVLLYEGYLAMDEQKKAEAAAKAGGGTAVKGFVGLDQIEGPHHRSVLPSQVNLGLSQNVAAPHGFGALMPSTAQGMTGKRYVRAFGTMSGGGR